MPPRTKSHAAHGNSRRVLCDAHSWVTARATARTPSLRDSWATATALREQSETTSQPLHALDKLFFLLTLYNLHVLTANIPLSLMDFDFSLTTTILLRLCCAAILGSLVGYERDVHGRAAGLRTHMLVSTGAALFTIMSLICSTCPLELPERLSIHGDCCRVAAQIVSGIGFLGAGTIVKSGFTVKGLTTAACLWFAAAVGMSCALGQWHIACIVTVAELFLVFPGKCLEKKFHRLFPFKLIVDTTDFKTIDDVKQLITDMKCELTTLNISVTNNSQKSVRGIFYIDTKSHNQIDICMSLTQKIIDDFDNVTSVEYKSEG